MKTFLKITALVAITVALLGPARLFASQPAGPAQTYHGTLTGGTFFCNGAPVSGFIVTGKWNVNIDPATPAQVTLNVSYNGRHHKSFGYNGLMLVSYRDGVYTFSGFGDAAAATINTTVTPATFSWHVELGVSCPSQNPYNSLTYLGVADRGDQ